jgi:hypothetical protein
MEAEGQARKELLVKHGLVETVLEDFTRALGQFDAAVESGAEGRAAHVGASAELSAIAVAENGAQVVHAEAARLALARQLPLFIYSYRSPLGEFYGTAVSSGT